MDKRLPSLFLLSLGTVLSLAVSIQARADFIIKFTDSGQVLVHRYVEEGQTIKVYTSQGTISFRKDDVKQITEVDAGYGMSIPLETISVTLSPSEQASAPTSSGSQGMTDAGKTAKTGKEDTTGASDTVAAEVERINDRYQEVEQEFNKLWGKHVQDINSGTSEGILADEVRRLDELDRERHKLVKDARRAVPDELPTWAQ